MGKKFEYTTILVKGSFNGTYAPFPFDSRKEFGTGKAIFVKIIVDGFDYKMNLLPNGEGGHWLHLKKEIRDEIGKKEGDDVHIVLEREFSKPTLKIPDYLEWLLNEEIEMKKYFEKMSFSSKKFWITHLEESKNDDTKVSRINHLFEFLEKNYSGKK